MSDLDTPNHRAQAVIGRWQFLALRMNVCGYRHQETQSIGIALYQSVSREGYGCKHPDDCQSGQDLIMPQLCFAGTFLSAAKDQIQNPHACGMRLVKGRGPVCKRWLHLISRTSHVCIPSAWPDYVAGLFAKMRKTAILRL